jgi:hypothetical protein
MSFVTIELNEYVEMIEVLKMVEDNTKMPHQHSDLQTRLYCLAERAREVLAKSEYKEEEINALQNT